MKNLSGVSSGAIAEVGLLGCVLMVAGGSCFFLATSQAADRPVATVQAVTVTGGRNGIEVKIAASQPVATRSQVATDPDRLILDFLGALPGSGLRNQAINRYKVKSIRVGLFSRNPPVTRVVIDLKSTQPYRIYPSGKVVIVKLMMDQRQGAMGAHVNTVSYEPVVPKPEPEPKPKLEVVYKNERLSIRSDKASLAEVLGEVARKTGADISLPAIAAQEQVVARIGLLPVAAALAALLNGSRFNFIMVGSDGDPAALKSVILTLRDSAKSQPAIASPPPTADLSQPEPEASPQPEMQAQPQGGQDQQGNPQPQEDPRQREAAQPLEAPPPK
jgi:AMIN domain